jgi:hypothetical protein
MELSTLSQLSEDDLWELRGTFFSTDDAATEEIIEAAIESENKSRSSSRNSNDGGDSEACDSSDSEACDDSDACDSDCISQNVIWKPRPSGESESSAVASGFSATSWCDQLKIIMWLGFPVCIEKVAGLLPRFMLYIFLGSLGSNEIAGAGLGVVFGNSK